MQDELFPIKNFEGLYAITKNGRVWSYPRRGTINNGKFLKTHLDRKGYVRICLNNKKVYTFGIHKLVAQTFMPKIEGKDQINHIDGNKLNNNLSNLERCTNQENAIHAFKLGLRRSPQGSKSGNSKLKEYQIPQIRSLLKEGRTLRFIANIYNVDMTLISLIKRGLIWKHVK